jgi:hypothetical protein
VAAEPVDPQKRCNKMKRVMKLADTQTMPLFFIPIPLFLWITYVFDFESSLNRVSKRNPRTGY